MGTICGLANTGGIAYGATNPAYGADGAWIA